MNRLEQNTCPAGCLISNGRYSTFVTSAGTGQSRRSDHVVNRWLNDPVEDSQGLLIYLKDLESGLTWSVGTQPISRHPTRYETHISPAQFHVLHENEGIEANLHVAVSPEEDFEIRRLRLKNRSKRIRRIEITSYFEAVLNWQDADLGHPAFSKLFLQTKFLPECNMLLVQRRPRGANESWPTLFHFLAGGTAVECETDRLQFLGRRNTVAAPRAMTASLSGTVGNVLDPCCALRAVVELTPYQEQELSFFTGIVDTPTQAREIWQKYQAPSSISTLFSSAEKAERDLWTELAVTESQAKQFQALATAIILGDRQLVPKIEQIARDADVNALFARLQIPRDRKQITLMVDDLQDPLLQEMMTMRRYWEKKGFQTNLIVLTDAKANVEQRLDDRGFVIDRSCLSGVEQSMILVTSSLALHEPRTDIELNTAPVLLPPLETLRSRSAPESNFPSASLQFFNGYGGFSKDGSEYVIQLPVKNGIRQWPPMPWINVIANEQFGFLLTESGAGCTWRRNSQANRLTPWSNDPIVDPHGEVIYLRDEETGQVSSPMPGPVNDLCDYEVRHGFGYSQFLSQSEGMEREATLFVPRHDPVKMVLLRLTNQTTSPKRISITSYQQLIMGSAAQRPSLIVSRTANDGSLRASSLGSGPFRGSVAFSSLQIGGASHEESHFTCDRLSFLGRFGTPGNPAAMHQGVVLDGSVGVGLDPCFVLQGICTIEPGVTVECATLFGEGLSDDEASLLIERYRNFSQIHQTLADVREYWTSLLGCLQVETPSPIFNVMANGWLTYQTISCRLWARSAFYQSSGAYGYRDQIQDAGNLLPLALHFAREQIMLHARHQFEEGDVLHWWNPEPLENGLRTRFSDDLLWLPYITADYIQATGDFELLSTPLPFLHAPTLKPGEDEAFLQPEVSVETADLYEHCCRAIDRSLGVGRHGLPLMGTGDWNDGMNRVGREGEGESVWLGFFLYRILEAFLPYCQRRGDTLRAARYTEHHRHLRVAVNDSGWDGEWYRRAYYDNGDPLGSSTNDECRIDALAQAWAVLSGVAPPDRSDLAIQALFRQLISEEEGLIRLLAPPFVNTRNDPGYIKGYIAGIRENGGQYTHAACWVVMAIAQQGHRERALQLWEMLTPVSHTLTREAAQQYMLEPYSMPGDIYGALPHIGRGGWSWYTGSSGWMYRTAIESILGIRIEHGDTLVISPCIPDSWPSYQVRLNQPGRAICEIVIENPLRSSRRIASATINDLPVPVSGSELRIPLAMDIYEHKVRVILE